MSVSFLGEPGKPSVFYRWQRSVSPDICKNAMLEEAMPKGEIPRLRVAHHLMTRSAKWNLKDKRADYRDPQSAETDD